MIAVSYRWECTGSEEGNQWHCGTREILVLPMRLLSVLVLRDD